MYINIHFSIPPHWRLPAFSAFFKVQGAKIVHNILKNE